MRLGHEREPFHSGIFGSVQRYAHGVAVKLDAHRSSAFKLHRAHDLGDA
jgi:hypothetical protein